MTNISAGPLKAK
jgi:hypothetical protein